MSTPTWKKNFIIIFGLLENLTFSGTIMGWSALNYMLKSEGVYQNLCHDIKPHHHINDYNTSIVQTNQLHLTQKVNNIFITDKTMNLINKAVMNVWLANTHNDSNLTLLEESKAYHMEPRLSLTHESEGCNAQDKVLNLAYTIGVFCTGFTACVWGFLLDKWGLRKVRLLMNFLVTGGVILLCYTSRDRPYLIFPAVILFCIGGVPLRIANMQFADLYPTKRSTIISLYSGAFCASAIVFVLLKYLFEFGVSHFVAVLILVLVSLLMFPFTLFILPSDRIREESETKTSNTTKAFNRKSLRSSFSIIPPVTLEMFTLIASPYFTRKNITIDEDMNTNRNATDIDGINNEPVFWIKDQSHVVVVPATKSSSSPPLKISLCSWAFNLHQWWFSWLLTYMAMYVGSLNLWLERVPNGLQTATSFVKIYGIVQILSLVLAPIAGIFMDFNIKKANRETDPFKRKLQRVRASFWPIFTTTLFTAACLVCRFFDNQLVIYISIAFMTISRCFLVAIGTVYLRIRFHGEHFNRLLGIMSTTGSIVSLLQFPLFVWESQSPINAIWVNIFSCLCTLLAFMNPLHILITPLQTHLLLKEERKDEARPK